MTVFSGSRQAVTFLGEDGTKLYDGTTMVKLAEITGGEPAIARIKKKTGEKVVIARKEGYKNTPLVVESRFNLHALWNIFFWPGFFIDWGTGKICKYDPTVYNVELDKE